MSAIDWIVFGVLLGSAALGAYRGFVREVFSLAAWVLAFIAAKGLSPWVSLWMPGLVEEESIRYAAAIVLVFVLVWIVATLVGGLLASMVKWIGLGPYDHFAGLGFGLLRAFVLLLGLAILAGLTALPRTEAWQRAWTRAPLEGTVLELRPWLPQALADLIRFEAQAPANARLPEPGWPRSGDRSINPR